MIVAFLEDSWAGLRQVTTVEQEKKTQWTPQPGPFQEYVLQK